MRSIALLGLAMFVGVAQGADVYRSVTEDGTVVYGDRPFGDNVDVVHVTVVQQPANAVPITVAPVRQAATVGLAPTSTDDPADQMTNAQIAQRIAENCELSKRQLAVLESTDDLVRTAPDGTMERLSADEMVEARAIAAAEVDEWCGEPASAAP